MFGLQKYKVLSVVFNLTSQVRHMEIKGLTLITLNPPSTLCSTEE